MLEFDSVSDISINQLLISSVTALYAFILTSSTSLSRAIIVSGADRLALVAMVVPTGDASLT